MNETTNPNSTTDETRTDKRAWQTPTIEVFDVATVTQAGPGPGPAPVDFITYLS